MIFETATNTYTARDSIGNGGCGTVFRVKDDEGNAFAIKLLRETSLSKRKRFKNELNFCRNNRHERILTVLDDGIRIDGLKRQPFYVMALYDSTLRKLMTAGLDYTMILPVFSDLLDGVEAAHLQRVIHRDLKPENLLIKLPELRAVVADFGIAHFEEDDLITAVRTRDGDRLANFRYASPEQRETGRQITARCDIYALGLILNEMFTHEVPLGTSYKEIAAVAPEFAYLDPIVAQMIRQDADLRPATIGELKEMLIIRRTEFINLQKLDATRRSVVTLATPDDPLGGADVVATNFDYEPGWLHLRLDPAPPPKWRLALNSLTAYGCFSGIAEPSTVQIEANGKSMVPANEQIVGDVARYVKEWVAMANVGYRNILNKDAVEAEHRERQRLAQQAAQLEQKARAMERLRQSLEV